RDLRGDLRGHGGAAGPGVSRRGAGHAGRAADGPAAARRPRGGPGGPRRGRRDRRALRPAPRALSGPRGDRDQSPDGRARGGDRGGRPGPTRRVAGCGTRRPSRTRERASGPRQGGTAMRSLAHRAVVVAVGLGLALGGPVWAQAPWTAPESE